LCDRIYVNGKKGVTACELEKRTFLTEMSYESVDGGGAPSYRERVALPARRSNKRQGITSVISDGMAGYDMNFEEGVIRLA
jgi:hypothetical protein